MATASLLGRAEARVPPHDLEAESSVLGAILLDPAAITRILDFLDPEDFYRENHGQVYRASLSLFREGEPIDNVTVAAELEKMGVLERVGGRAQLALLQESVPTAANVEYYARIVKDRAYKRRLITAGSQVTALGYNEALDADEAVNEAQSHVYAISDDRVGAGLERLYDLLKPAMDRIDAQMASGGGVVGIASGFHDLDRMTNGFKNSEMVVIAGRPSMGKCLTAGTLIDDPASGRRIRLEDAVRSRLPAVMGMSESGAIRPTPVAAWIDSGVQSVFRVRTRTGRMVEVTGHHPFLTASGWQPLHDMVVGDLISVPRRLVVFGSDDSLSPDRVRLLARRLAAGPARFPDCAWGWDRPRLREFLRVLMSCAGPSGAPDGRSIRYRAASHGLAEDVRHALTRFGIVAALRRRTGRSWSVEITEQEAVDLYLSEIGCLGESAPRSARHDRRGGGNGTDQHSDEGRRVGAAAAAGGRAAPAAALADCSLTGSVSDRAQTPSDLFWDEVVAIEPIGRHQVYDLEVPDGANFIAQDVVVHNTSMVLNIALNAAVEQNKPIAIFSLEMSKEQLVERMLCEQARIDAQRLHRGMLSEVEYERLARALGPLSDAPIFIDDSPTLDDLTLRLKARQAKSRERVEMVILDYLQLMHGRSSGYDHNRVQEVSAISRSLKGIARELRVPVIAISQLSRAPEARPDKRPILSDLRESGCMPASARILRADTGHEITLGELVRSREQPLVWSLDDDWRLRPRRLVKSFPTGTRPVFRLRLTSGCEVDATENHPFRTVQGWTRLDRLSVGDSIAVPRRLPAPLLEQTWTEDELTRRNIAHLGPHPDADLAPHVDPAREPPELDATDVFWDEIAEVTAIGDMPTFDATVEGTHNFVANGVIAHNSIEQDADVVIFLYRDDYYNREKSERPGIAEVIVAKHRNGPTGTVELMFRRELTRFENLDRRRPGGGGGPGS